MRRPYGLFTTHSWRCLAPSPRPYALRATDILGATGTSVRISSTFSKIHRHARRQRASRLRRPLELSWTRSRASSANTVLGMSKVPPFSSSTTQRSTPSSLKTRWATASKFATTGWIDKLVRERKRTQLKREIRRAAWPSAPRSLEAIAYWLLLIRTLHGRQCCAGGHFGRGSRERSRLLRWDS